MNQLDLADICKHLKAAVIPHTPEDFILAEAFKLGLLDDELRAGIAAFRSFLYELYDALASGKDRFDVKTGIKNGTLPARFPIIEDLGAILFQMGIHGKLETEPRNELIIHGEDMLHVSKMQKYKHINKMSKMRKIELFDFLSSLGFYFEDVDFSDDIDFSTIGTFYAQYENDESLLTGLKLMALAQANVRAKYDRYSTILMRGDFYPLANAKPKPPIVNITEYVNTQPPDIKEWVIGLDELLAQSCKVVGEVRYFLCDGIFTYSSRKTKKVVCKIDLRAKNSSVIPNANHLEDSKDILNQLTEFMLDTMRSKNRNCKACSELNNPNFVNCPYGGGEPYKFSYKGEDFELCRHNGFEFLLNNEMKRNVLRNWIELELAWGN
ncbi:MAG: hypothetical protein FWC73_01570 [Defluviitaleaceae bacterium]|nr:hypothetical protein [Defluviitaleaceae bacterium]